MGVNLANVFALLAREALREGEFKHSLEWRNRGITLSTDSRRKRSLKV